jgi:hypothetical protein
MKVVPTTVHLGDDGTIQNEFKNRSGDPVAAVSARS